LWWKALLRASFLFLVPFVSRTFQNRPSSLGFIFVTVLIDVLGFGLLMPVLPELIAHLSHHTLETSARDYGLLLALFGAMQFLFAPLLGLLSDRYGRRPVLLISLFFGAVDYVLMALAPTLLWLYVGRILSGITGANFTVAGAYIADVSPPEKRAQNFGIIGAAFGAGFVIGPALGGFLAQWGPRLPFWAAAALCAANFLYGWLILPESHKPENRRASFSWREANPVGALRVLGKYPMVWGLAGIIAATNLAIQCVGSTWVLFTAVRFGWDTRQTGISLAAFGAITLIFQLGVARIVLPHWGERKTIIIGLCAGAVEFAVYAFATQGWMMYAIMVAGGIGMLGGQAAQGLVSRQVSESEQGALQGALTSLNSVMGIFGPLIATGLFAYFTSAQSAVRLPGAPFLLASLLNVFALVLALRAFLRLREPATAA
jgi:DHA1 family tetracycline resistance protein-like MFS transporter